MKNIFYSSSSIDSKHESINTDYEKKDQNISNVESKHKYFVTNKKIKKMNKKELMENAFFLSEIFLSNETKNFIEEEDEKDNIIEEELSYFEKQNQFFMEYKNVPKKMPYEIVFTQEIEIDDNDRICKSLSSLETSDYDKISPKNNKKEIEILVDKSKLSLLFLNNNSDDEEN